VDLINYWFDGRTCSGCILNTGHPPFLAENYEDLKAKIVEKDMPAPKVRGLCSLCLCVCLC